MQVKGYCDALNNVRPRKPDVEWQEPQCDKEIVLWKDSASHLPVESDRSDRTKGASRQVKVGQKECEV
jgi:hypothetical protein